MQAAAPPPAAAPARARTALALLPTLLALVAEGAWVAVVAALFQAAVQQPIELTAAHLAVAAVAGMVVAARLEGRLQRAWPVTAVVLVGLAGATGWLLSPAARDALLTAGPGEALAVHPGGWLAALAFLRGIAHADPADRPHRAAGSAGSLLVSGIVAIVLSFVLGGAIAEPGRSAFAAAAVRDTIAFIGAGLIGRSLARIVEQGRSGGLDWRRNPFWVGLLLVLVVGVLALAVPGSFVLGPLVVFVVALLPVPLLVAGLLSGLDRRALRLLAAVSGVAALVFLVIRAFATPGASLVPGGGGGVAQPNQTDQPWMTAAAWTLLLVAVVATVAILAALWMRHAAIRADDDVAEERTIDRGHASGAAPRRWFRRRARPGSRPTDAVTAYLAAVAELDRAASLRRMVGETPAEHARRLRATGAAARAVRDGAPGFGQSLDLLAADYELARFGERAITPREDRRAIDRWRRIRDVVRHLGRDRGSVADADPPRPDGRLARDRAS